MIADSCLKFGLYAIVVVLLGMGLLGPLDSDAAESDSNASGTRFGGPDAVDNLIEEDSSDKGVAIDKRLVQGWFDWKAGIQEDHGLSLGMDYSSFFVRASETGLSSEDAASGGMFRFFGSWDLLGRGSANAGGLVWKIENRHTYTSIAPADVEFDQGGIGINEPVFSDQGGRVTNLYWRQRLKGGSITLVGGFLDATDYLDVFALASPWTGFLNFAFMTGTTTAFLPNDATLGIVASGMLGESIYAIAGVTNAYSDPKVPFRGFDLVGEGEFFKSIEIGWTPSQDRIYFDNAHVTYWHVDASSLAGTPGGWGVNLQYVRYLNQNWMPFFRAGYADEGGSLMEQSISTGFGYQGTGSASLLGVAFNWGKPNESSFGSGLNDQYTCEVFYRFQLTQQLAITPDVQMLLDPPNNADHSSIWMVGLRARLAL
ncbi:MAG: porin [Candidatus Krumholzibacteriia bacterium]|jgi:porin